MIAATPLIILFVGAYITFVAAYFSHDKKPLVGSALSSIFIAMSLASLIPIMRALTSGAPASFPVNALAFTATLKFDPLSILISVTALTLGLMVSIFSFKYMEDDTSRAKYYALLLIMLGAIVGLSAAGDLFDLWVFFELMCVSSYILVSFRKDRWEPLEAGFKYLIMSAAGSMMVLLGISVVFGQTGTLDLLALRSALAQTSLLPVLGAAVLFIAGFAVKAAIVPFHTWLPDAHSEAPSGISAMLSGIVIEAGLFAMIRTLLSFAKLNINIGAILIVLAVLSMFVGNLMALTQTRLKRMLAYSSIAQMGYIVLGLGIGIQFFNPTGITGGLFHIITHAGMKGLAFLCAGIVIHSIGSGEISEMSGLAKKMPLVAVSFAVSFLALAGVPPFSGFMSKLMIYQSGITVGAVGYVLSALAILNSVISLGYYLPALNVFFSSNVHAKVEKAHSVPVFMLLPVVILAGITVLLGIYPDIALALVEPAKKYMLVMLGGPM